MSRYARTRSSPISKLNESLIHPYPAKLGLVVTTSLQNVSTVFSKITTRFGGVCTTQFVESILVMSARREIVLF